MEKEKQEMIEKGEIGAEEVMIAVLGILILIGTVLIAVGGIYYEFIVTEHLY